RNRNPESRNPIPETRNPHPETRYPKPDTRNTKHETRVPKHETRHPTPDTRNPKPEIRPGPTARPPCTTRASTEKTGVCSRPVLHSGGYEARPPPAPRVPQLKGGQGFVPAAN
ncbi:hypothetical protein T484DRAFT_1627823, partial [Baffinella frigidus]